MRIYYILILMLVLSLVVDICTMFQERVKIQRVEKIEKRLDALENYYDTYNKRRG